MRKYKVYSLFCLLLFCIYLRFRVVLREYIQEDRTSLRNNLAFATSGENRSNLLPVFKDYNMLPVQLNWSKLGTNLGETFPTSSPNQTGLFQAFSSVYVLSAHLDNRHASTPVVRILVLQRTNDLTDFVCGFYKNNQLYRTPIVKYEMCENHGKLYGGWIYSCPIPSELSEDQTVSALLGSHTGGFSNNAMITLTIPSWKPKVKSKFGLCVPPLFGNVGVSKLIQFIEFYLLLGASRFTFYLYQTSEEVKRALSYYQMKGLVTLLDWNLPVHVKSKDIWYHAQILSVQECLYRNRDSFEYLIFTDLDEFIIPRERFTLQDMIQNIKAEQNATQSIAGYTFQSAFFNQDGIDEKRNTDIYSLQQFKRTKQTSNFRTKVIVNPLLVFEVGIHHISKISNNNSIIVDVAPSMGLVHHYRSCNVVLEPTINCQQTSTDYTVLKYASALQRNYDRTVANIIKQLFINI